MRGSFSPHLVTRSADSARGATPAQVALAWLLDGSPFVVPIPGTKRRRYLEENLAATSLQLTAEEIEQLEELAGQRTVSGARYNDSDLAKVGVEPSPARRLEVAGAGEESRKTVRG